MAREIPPGKNRLALEKSPYLLQHADNPVDWYPWGDEAFAKAKAEDKPIFLSIGYSTCHWCHVMEHESFEDTTVARLMNDTFVSIKVDREERPDIDNIYMTVCQMMTGHGGWPLTVVMDPDRRPFFATTYIPRDNRYGAAGMIDLIPQIQAAWRDRRSDIETASDQLLNRLQEIAAQGAGEDDLGAPVLDLAYEQLTQRYDSQRGGFGEAPKFPTPHNLLFLLRYWKRTGNEHALEMVEQTLDAMAGGGIYDHVGFGFHRYSTDARWFAPHFEKMLYDQALLVMAYTEAFQATGNPEYQRVVEHTIAYVARDMTDEKGGFYSAEDADSEGIEGKFYLWTVDDIRALLDEDDASFAIDVFGVTPSGNFSEEVAGGNILYLQQPIEAVAAQRGTGGQELRDRVERVRAAMFDERQKRIHPHKDDKVLADWNGLMIAALAMAGRVFDSADYTALAERAAKFVLGEMRIEGQLLHRYREGDASIEGLVDDFAFLIWAMIELYETTFDVTYLQEALELNEQMMDRFWDAKSGGLFFTTDRSPDLIVRMKEVYDGAVPSGNSVAMLNLIRLGRLTGNPALEKRAAMIGRAFHEAVSQGPSAYTMLLTALEFGVGPSYEVVIVGDREADDTRAMHRALNRVFVPNKVVVYKPLGDDDEDIVELATFTKTQTAIDGKATAYVCKNYACDLPTTKTEQMLDLLVPDDR